MWSFNVLVAIDVTEFAKNLENKKHHKEKEEWTYQNHFQIQTKEQ